MEDLTHNKAVWVVAAVTILNLVLFVGGKLVIDKAADQVIQRLQKEYSPSPYGPGFDPDKVDPDIFRKRHMEVKTVGFGATRMVVVPLTWRQEWEMERFAD